MELTESETPRYPAALAVIVPFHNGATDLDNLLRSIEAAARRTTLWSNIGVVVVDNASNPEDLGPVFGREELASVVSLSENLGYGAAVNKGFDVAMNDRVTISHVLVLNSDTVLDPDCLAELGAAVQANPRGTVISPIIRTFEGAMWFSGGYFEWCKANSRHHVDEPASPRRTEVATGCALLLPVGAWKRVGPWRDDLFMYYEDVEYSARLRRLGIPVIVWPAALVNHKVAGTPGNSPSLYTYYSIRNRLWIFRELGVPGLVLGWVATYLWAKSWLRGGGVARRAIRDGRHRRQHTL